MMLTISLFSVLMGIGWVSGSLHSDLVPAPMLSRHTLVKEYTESTMPLQHRLSKAMLFMTEEEATGIQAIAHAYPNNRPIISELVKNWKWWKVIKEQIFDMVKGEGISLYEKFFVIMIGLIWGCGMDYHDFYFFELFPHKKMLIDAILSLPVPDEAFNCYADFLTVRISGAVHLVKEQSLDTCQSVFHQIHHAGLVPFHQLTLNDELGRYYVEFLGTLAKKGIDIEGYASFNPHLHHLRLLRILEEVAEEYPLGVKFVLSFKRSPESLSYYVPYAWRIILEAFLYDFRGLKTYGPIDYDCEETLLTYYGLDFIRGIRNPGYLLSFLEENPSFYERLLAHSIKDSRIALMRELIDAILASPAGEDPLKESLVQAIAKWFRMSPEVLGHLRTVSSFTQLVATQKQFIQSFSSESKIDLSTVPLHLRFSLLAYWESHAEDRLKLLRLATLDFAMDALGETIRHGLPLTEFPRLLLEHPTVWFRLGGDYCNFLKLIPYTSLILKFLSSAFVPASIENEYYPMQKLIQDHEELTLQILKTYFLFSVEATSLSQDQKMDPHFLFDHKNHLPFYQRGVRYLDYMKMRFPYSFTLSDGVPSTAITNMFALQHLYEVSFSDASQSWSAHWDIDLFILNNYFKADFQNARAFLPKFLLDILLETFDLHNFEQDFIKFAQLLIAVVELDQVPLLKSLSSRTIYRGPTAEIRQNVIRIFDFIFTEGKARFIPALTKTFQGTLAYDLQSWRTKESFADAVNSFFKVKLIK